MKHTCTRGYRNFIYVTMSVWIIIILAYDAEYIDIYLIALVDLIHNLYGNHLQFSSTSNKNYISPYDNNNLLQNNNLT